MLGDPSVPVSQPDDERLPDPSMFWIDRSAADPPRPLPRPFIGREIGEVELAGRKCHVLLADGADAFDCDVDPAHRARTAGADDEIVRFEFEGHRYVLVAEARRRREVAPVADPASSIDIGRLLSSREMQVVQLVCMGFLTKQIADRLHISEFTVRSYLKTIYAKLGVRSRAALVFRFMKTFNADAGTRE